MPDILNVLTTNVAGGILVALFTFWLGWQTWRKREKLLLSYTITESDFFPFHNGQGKYYAIKISNNGGKEIKNITTSIDISDSEIDQVTKHELINDLKKEVTQIKFRIDTLNPNEDIDFVITSKVTKTSKPSIKIRGEGVNGLEKSYAPSKSDIVGTAIIFTGIGFLLTVLYISLMSNRLSKNDPSVDRMDNIFKALNKADLPQVFSQIIDKHDDITYEGTAFYLLNSYLKDTINGDKYIKALKNLTTVEDIAPNSKGAAYYLVYKIDIKRRNITEANEYLDKCKNETSDMYEFLNEQDKYYNLDSLQVRLLKYK